MRFICSSCAGKGTVKCTNHSYKNRDEVLQILDGAVNIIGAIIGAKSQNKICKYCKNSGSYTCPKCNGDGLFDDD